MRLKLFSLDSIIALSLYTGTIKEICGKNSSLKEPEVAGTRNPEYLRHIKKYPK
jgi:hypothetical protein